MRACLFCKRLAPSRNTPSHWNVCFAASLNASSPNRTTGKVIEEPSGPAEVISPSRSQQGNRMSSRCTPPLHHKVSGIGRFRLPTLRVRAALHGILKPKPPKRSAPMHDYSFTTLHGIEITRTDSQVNFRRGLWRLLRDLDQYRGIYLSSGYESPGRYSRWDIGSVNPPLEIVSYDRRGEFRPLHQRGRLIAGFLAPVLADHPHWEEFGLESGVLAGRLKPMPKLFPEEQRSRQPSVFSILRAIVAEFHGAGDRHLAL